MTGIEGVFDDEFSGGGQRGAVERHEDVIGDQFLQEIGKAVLVLLAARHEHHSAVTAGQILTNAVLRTGLSSEGHTLAMEGTDNAARIKPSAVSEVGALMWTDRVEGANTVIRGDEDQRRGTDVDGCDVAGELAFKGHEIPASAHVSSEQVRYRMCSASSARSSASRSS